MRDRINVRLEIDPLLQETEIIIRVREDYDESLVARLISTIRRLGESVPPLLTVYSGKILILLNRFDIVRAYKQDRKLYVLTERDIYTANETLQEFEKELDAENFVRTNRNEIVNIYKIRHYEYKGSSYLKLFFEDGSYTWVSRARVNFVLNVLQMNNIKQLEKSTD